MGLNWILSVQTRLGTKSHANDWHLLDSVPVGVPQTESTSENLCSWLQNQGITATVNLYPRTEIFK